jgi:hypothetical protein
MILKAIDKHVSSNLPLPAGSSPERKPARRSKAMKRSVPRRAAPTDPEWPYRELPLAFAPN